MKRFKYLLFIILLLSLGETKGQDLKEVHFDEMEALLSRSNDTLYVVNFWATWCKPCVEELPFFQKAANDNVNEKMRMILVSLDFQSQVESNLKPFIRDNPLLPEIWFLNEKKFSKFIPKVEEQWSGALPFTIVFRGQDSFRFWKEGAFKEGELSKTIELALN